MILKTPFSIASVTFREIVRDKILYNIVMITFLLFGVGILASKLTFVSPDRVILDFGLSAVALSSVIIGIFTGSGLLLREVERRTIYVSLSRPVSRDQFVYGKFLGLGAVLALNWLLLCAAFIAVLALGADSIASVVSPAFFLVLLMALFQGLMAAALSVLVSTRSTASLSAMITLGLYLVGSNTTQIRALAEKSPSAAAAFLLKAVSWVLPSFELLNFGMRATYKIPVSLRDALVAGAYGTCAIAAAILLAGFLFRGKEI